MHERIPTRSPGAQSVGEPATNRAPKTGAGLGPRLGPRAARRGQGRVLFAFVGQGARMGALALVIYSLLFNLSVVRGSSMTPGILDGDRILVEPWSYLIDDVERGDVVVLRYPLDPSVDYIKRIIGLPGDHVRMARGRVWINGELLEEPYVDARDPGSVTSLVVDDGNYFVLGDNRPRSSDSRDFGFVADELIRGRVDVRLWPPTRFGWVN